MRSNVRARMKTPLSFRASVGPLGGDAGLSEREIRASTATIRPTNSGSRRKAEEAPLGPHTRKPRLVFARYRALSRRQTETGEEKVEARLNRQRVTKNRGAGSVNWRSQLWRSNELGFQRMTCSLYGRGWRRFLNQEQLGKRMKSFVQEVWAPVPPSISC